MIKSNLEKGTPHISSAGLADIASPFRALRLIKGNINYHKLDLSGLTVLTEAATGYYGLTPIIAALAGADKVFAITKDSRYATAEEVKKYITILAKFAGVEDRIDVITSKTPEVMGQADVITNLGFVRPIDKEMISHMKSTAVVPLMFETWEYREEDLDLKTCLEKDIAVLGTNEKVENLAIFKYSGLLCLKQILDMDLEVINCKFTIVGGGVFAKNIIETLSKLGAEVWAVCPESRSEIIKLGAKKAGNNLKDKETRKKLKDTDAIIVASYPSEDMIIGADGEITADELKRLSNGIVVIQFFGEIDRTNLDKVDIPYTPKQDTGKGHMALTMGDLGPEPIIKLNTASLKVAEVMARARLEGCNVDETKAKAIEHASGQDFSLEQKRRYTKWRGE